MKKSNLVLALLCLTAIVSLSRVAMTQENDDGQRSSDFGSTEEKRMQPQTVPTFDSAPKFARPSNRSEDEEMNHLLQERFGRQSTQYMRPRQTSRTVFETVMEVVPPEEVKENLKLQAAIKSLKGSKDESEKKKAANIIQAQLKLQFERDLKRREKELADVEERVRSLREQLGKRKAAQDGIISLRLQTLVNEASGLGFPTNTFGGDGILRPSHGLGSGSFGVEGYPYSARGFTPPRSDDPAFFDDVDTRDASGRFPGAAGKKPTSLTPLYRPNPVEQDR